MKVSPFEELGVKMSHIVIAFAIVYLLIIAMQICYKEGTKVAKQSITNTINHE